MARKNTTEVLKVYNVQFVDDYAVLTATSVEGSDEDEALDRAITMLKDYYEIDVTSWMYDVEEIE